MKNNRKLRSRRGVRTASRRADSVTISGHQIYVDVKNGSNGTQLFTSNNIVPVSPDSFGTEIAELANHYNQYRFSRLIFEFKPLTQAMIMVS